MKQSLFTNYEWQNVSDFVKARVFIPLYDTSQFRRIRSHSVYKGVLGLLLHLVYTKVL